MISVVGSLVWAFFQQLVKADNLVLKALPSDGAYTSLQAISLVSFVFSLDPQ